MKIALVTDAWQPQVNGVVTTLVELVREVAAAGHQVEVIHPGLFRTRPCPGYAGIDLAVRPARHLAELLDSFQPDAIHLATEGPLGWAGRRYCLRRKLRFTTAFHTRFPEILHAAIRLPVGWGYALMRHFHKPSAGVMVPTDGVLQLLAARGFGNLRPWTHGVDVELFRFQPQARAHEALRDAPRPIALFVGRVSYEKNIEAFLRLDLPGTKVVCGVGPVEEQLRKHFPDVHWMGLQTRPDLAELYGAADVFVFPSRSETFGLVLLEAMACGTPVATFPVDGPLEVLARPGLDGQGSLGGVMHEDLGQACRAALELPRLLARQRALDFSWQRAAALFIGHLAPARGAGGEFDTVTKVSSTA